jgi:hypothetical protein
MPIWKVLFIMLMGAVCLTLTLATVIVPMTLVEDNYRWLWLGLLLVATIGMGTLFALYLKHADSTFKL